MSANAFGNSRSKESEKMSLLKAMYGTTNHVKEPATRPALIRKTKIGLFLNMIERKSVNSSPAPLFDLLAQLFAEFVQRLAERAVDQIVPRS